MLKKYITYFSIYLIFCLLIYLFFEFKNSFIEKYFYHYFETKEVLIEKGKNNKKIEILEILKKNKNLIKKCRNQNAEILIEYDNKKIYFEKRKDNNVYICEK